MAVPTIIDTDLGTDVDDSWALAMALRCPELDIRLVTASTADVRYRAALTAHLLAAAGRSDIPIALGIGGGNARAEQPLAALAAGIDLGAHEGGVEEDAVAAVARTVEAADEEVAIVGLGPLPTIAAAVTSHASIAARSRYVGMQGSWRVGYRGQTGPAAEYNVRTDVPGCRAVLAAPWAGGCTITPLDTCGSVVLEGDRYRRVLDAARSGRDPLLAALLDQQQQWLGGVGRSELFEQRTTTLYDTVAVYLAYDDALVRTEQVRMEVDDEGRFCGRPDAAAGAPPVRLATEWADQDAYLDHLVARLLGR